MTLSKNTKGGEPLIGILVVTHGRLSESLVETAEMFTGAVDGVECVCFTEGQGIEDLLASIQEKLIGMEDFDGVLCLVDMFGGSPARVLSLLLLENDQLELITGINLPLLIDAILSRENMPMANLVDYLVDPARNSITNLGVLLRS